MNKQMRRAVDRALRHLDQDIAAFECELSDLLCQREALKAMCAVAGVSSVK